MHHHWYVWPLIGFVAGSLAVRLTGIDTGGCLMTTLTGIAGGLIGGAVLERYSDAEGLGFLASTVVAFAFTAVFLGLLRLLGVRGADPDRLARRRRW